MLEVKSNRRTEPLFQESTWNEEEEPMTGLIFNLEGKHYCALTAHRETHHRCAIVVQSGPRRLLRKEESVCGGSIISKLSSGRTSRTRTGEGIGRKLGRIISC